MVDGVVKILESELYDSYDEIPPKETSKLERIFKGVRLFMMENNFTKLLFNSKDILILEHEPEYRNQNKSKEKKK